MSCGHEHDHGHGHDHDHGHDHHEETVEIPWGTARLEAHTHEQAATVSMVLSPAADTAIAFGDIVALMQRIAEAAEEAGGIIGHIKGFARQDNSFVHASVTAADIEPATEGNTAMECNAGADVQLVAIVLLVTQDDLVSICKAALQEDVRDR